MMIALRDDIFKQVALLSVICIEELRTTTRGLGVGIRKSDKEEDNGANRPMATDIFLLLQFAILKTPKTPNALMLRALHYARMYFMRPARLR